MSGTTCILGTPPSKLKDLGSPPENLCVGNPVNAGNGNKFQAEVDYRDAALGFSRYYNGSSSVQGSNLGPRWRGSYDRAIVVSTTPSVLRMHRPDGKAYAFTRDGTGAWKADADLSDRLVELQDGGARTGWRYIVAADDSVETYNAAGKLTSIADRAGRARILTYDLPAASGGDGDAGTLDRVSDDTGRQLRFTHDAGRRIAAVTDPGGGVYAYAYDGDDNLVSVTYPDGKTRTYRYNEPEHTSGASQPHALTGIVDENGVRFATFQYDATGRAVSTGHANGADLYRLAYTTDANGDPVATVVTDPLGTSRTLSLTTVLGVAKSAGQSQPGGSGCGPASSAATYDANGNVAARTDFNGRSTTYTYDLARNLETGRTEAAGSAQARSIATAWHPSFRLPVSITEPGRVTTYAYDSRGNLTQKSVRDPASNAVRTWTWSYTYAAAAPGLTLQRIEDGPRTDVSDLTVTDYYPADAACAGATPAGLPNLGCRGQVSQVTNALGHVTRIPRYTPHGQPEVIVDPNGLATTLAYDARQRLVSRSVGAETTTYQYDGAGQLTRVVLPDGGSLGYAYDAAHRLIAVSDAAGNRVAYTLDAMGNRVRETVTDPSGTLALSRSRAFDALNRLWKDIGAQGQTTQYAYDAQGNRTGVVDPLGRATTQAYDALDRLVRITDPGGGNTLTAYDSLDQTRSVTDPNGNATQTSYNALGDLVSIHSPDSGLTQQSFDAAGNLVSRTDAKGQTSTYDYDALNRVTRIRHADGQSEQYSYDQGHPGKLTSISDATGATRTAYDSHGRVVSETRSILGVDYVTAYRYDAAGRLVGLTYPGGRQVNYSLDALGRVSGIDTAKDGQTRTLVSGAAYHPVGGVKSYTYGNGETQARGFDADGRIQSFTLAGQARLLNYDAASRITALGDLQYGYDTLDRLSRANGQVNGANVDQSFAYDANGNRTRSADLGANGATQTRQYSLASGSNRLAAVTGADPQSYTHDANGSVTADNARRFGYDARGRLIRSEAGGRLVEYGVNALGQRVTKREGNAVTVFHYDLGGRLIAETGAQGTVIREHLYLDNLPVALVGRPGSPSGGTNVVIDNPKAVFTGAWPAATAGAGFEGADYQSHPPHPGTVQQGGAQ